MRRNKRSTPWSVHSGYREAYISNADDCYLGFSYITNNNMDIAFTTAHGGQMRMRTAMLTVGVVTLYSPIVGVDVR